MEWGCDVFAIATGGAMESDEARASSSDSSDAPTPAADQMRASGSARRKVALPAGRSQLDWMRNSRRQARPKLRPVTMEEVAKHKTAEDAWLVVDDVVYNVSPYLEYHPGGVRILVSAAGKDASALFHKYHPWVNVQSMLERCVVGYIGGARARR